LTEVAFGVDARGRRRIERGVDVAVAFDGSAF